TDSTGRGDIANMLPSPVKGDIPRRLADDQSDFTFKRQQLSAGGAFYYSVRFRESASCLNEVARILRPTSTLCRPGLKSHMDRNHFARMIREERRNSHEEFLSTH